MSKRSIESDHSAADRLNDGSGHDATGTASPSQRNSDWAPPHGDFARASPSQMSGRRIAGMKPRRPGAGTGSAINSMGNIFASGTPNAGFQQGPSVGFAAPASFSNSQPSTSSAFSFSGGATNNFTFSPTFGATQTNPFANANVPKPFQGSVTTPETARIAADQQVQVSQSASYSSPFKVPAAISPSKTGFSLFGAQQASSLGPSMTKFGSKSPHAQAGPFDFHTAPQISATSSAPDASVAFGRGSFFSQTPTSSEKLSIPTPAFTFGAPAMPPQQETNQAVAQSHTQRRNDLGTFKSTGQMDQSLDEESMDVEEHQQGHTASQTAGADKSSQQQWFKPFGAAPQEQDLSSASAPINNALFSGFGSGEQRPTFAQDTQPRQESSPASAQPPPTSDLFAGAKQSAAAQLLPSGTQAVADASSLAAGDLTNTTQKTFITQKQCIALSKAVASAFRLARPDANFSSLLDVYIQQMLQLQGTTPNSAESASIDSLQTTGQKRKADGTMPHGSFAKVRAHDPSSDGGFAQVVSPLPKSGTSSIFSDIVKSSEKVDQSPARTVTASKDTTSEANGQQHIARTNPFSALKPFHPPATTVASGTEKSQSQQNANHSPSDSFGNKSASNPTGIGFSFHKNSGREDVSSFGMGSTTNELSGPEPENPETAASQMYMAGNVRSLGTPMFTPFAKSSVSASVEQADKSRSVTATSLSSVSFAATPVVKQAAGTPISFAGLTPSLTSSSTTQAPTVFGKFAHPITAQTGGEGKPALFGQGFKPDIKASANGSVSSFLGQFAQQAAKTEAAEKAKRRAEEFDSDEDDEIEWERQDAAKQAERKRVLDEQACAKTFKPSFNAPSTAAPFISQFASDAAKTEAAEKAKRKADEFDSDEDDAEEWERQDAERQAEKKRKLHEEARFNKVKFDGSAFAFNASTDASACAPDTAPATQPSSQQASEVAPSTALHWSSAKVTPPANDAIALTDDTGKNHTIDVDGATKASHADFAPQATGSVESATGRSLFERTTPKSAAHQLGTDKSSAASASSGEPFSFGGSLGDQTWKPDSPINFASSDIPTLGLSAANFGKGSQQFSLPGSGIRAFSDLSSSVPASGNTKPSLFGGVSHNNVYANPFSSLASGRQSILFPPAPKDAVDTPRGMSPGTGTDKDSANGVAGDDADVETHEQADFYAIPADEEVLFEQSDVKALANDNKAWETRGRGIVRLLRNTKSGAGSILMRMVPSGKVVLNSRVQKQLAYAHAGNGRVTMPILNGAGKIENWLLQFGKGNEEIALRFVGESEELR